jgi:hypothetical protein
MKPVSDQPLDPLIPPADNVFMIIDNGFSGSVEVPFAWKDDRSWLSDWLEALLLAVALELLAALASGSAEAE